MSGHDLTSRATLRGIRIGELLISSIHLGQRLFRQSQQFDSMTAKLLEVRALADETNDFVRVGYARAADRINAKFKKNRCQR